MNARRAGTAGLGTPAGLLPDSFRFAPGDAGLVACLEHHGVAVVAGALREGEVHAIQALVWDWLCALGVDRYDLNAWQVEEGCWPHDNMSRRHRAGTGIVASNGAGQSAAAWTARIAPGVRSAFAHVWATDELMTSMDGLVLWRPWQQRPSSVSEEWRTESGWLHIDQHILKYPGRLLVQGMLALSDAHPERTGGFICVPNAHRICMQDQLRAHFRQQLGHRRLTRFGDFLPIAEEDPLQRSTVFVPLRAGDLVLWDSRLPHASEPAPRSAAEGATAIPKGIAALETQQQVQEERAPITAALLRMAMPICMVPRSLVAADAAQSLRSWRFECIRRGITTKHWPHKMRAQGSAGGPGYNPPVLTEAMLALL